jgi:hypothetical protein
VPTRRCVRRKWLGLSREWAVLQTSGALARAHHQKIDSNIVNVRRRGALGARIAGTLHFP